MKKIICISGKSNSGKTGLIVRLVDYFNEKNIRVGVIKHDTHLCANNNESIKDTDKIFAAGCSKVMLAAPDKIVLTARLSEQNPQALADMYFNDCDFVITEGYKNSDILKIEVIADNMIASKRDSNLIAIVINNYKKNMDEKKIEKFDGLIFDYNEIEQIAELIIRRLNI